MSIQELTEALSVGTFIGDGISTLVYRFDAQTMKISNSYLAKWSLYQENNKLYLKTEPSIKGEDFLIQITSEKYPLSLNLSTKFTRKHFITLTGSY